MRKTSWTRCLALLGAGLIACAQARRVRSNWSDPKTLTAALAAWLLGLALPAAAAAQPGYRLDFLGQPPDDAYSYELVDLNSAGLITGQLSFRSGFSQTFLLRDGRFQRLAMPVEGYSSPVDMNERGEVVGNIERAGSSNVPFLYSRGRTTLIPLPADAGARARVVDINNLGQVLGVAEDGRAFIHDGRGTRYLDAGGLAFGRAAAFNDRGEVFGSYTFSNEFDELNSQPFIWRDGAVTLLPEFREDGYARFQTVLTDAEMNNAGQVAFTVFGNNDRYDNDRSGYLYSEGRYDIVGGGTFSPLYLSENGWAVGVSYSISSDPEPNQLWLYRDGVRTELRTLVPPEGISDYTLHRAHAIDPRGRILISGDRGIVVATPVPEAATLGMMLAGLVVLVPLRRRLRAGRAG